MAIMTPRELGTRVRSLREGRDLTQDQLAELTGLAADTVRRIEQGKYGPSFATLVKVAVAFGLTVAELLRDEMDPAYQFAAVIRNLPEPHQRVALAMLGMLYTDSLRLATD